MDILGFVFKIPGGRSLLQKTFCQSFSKPELVAGVFFSQPRWIGCWF